MGWSSVLGVGGDVEAVWSAAAGEVGGGDAVAAVVDEGDAGGVAAVGEDGPVGRWVRSIGGRRWCRVGRR